MFTRRMQFIIAAVIVMAFAPLAIFPSFAQDEPGTIADIVIESVSAETPEFTILLTAIQNADPIIFDTLSDPEARLTVFAPTDAAFAALEETMGELAFQGMLADTAELTDMLLFHVTDILLMSGDLTALLEANAGATSVTTLQGQSLDLALTTDDGITVNGVKLNLTMVDIPASNGVIHIIDTVLMPETRSIAEILVQTADMAEHPEFTVLLQAIQAADTTVLATLANSDFIITLFAPTDSAFAALGGETLRAILADQQLLTTILLYHHVPGAVSGMELNALLLPAADFTTQLVTTQSQNITITKTDDGIFINDARLIMTDIDASNGVIHVIDTVLLPPIE